MLSKRLKDIISIHCTMLWCCVMVELIDNFINQLSLLHKKEDFNYNVTICELVLEKERHHEHLKRFQLQYMYFSYNMAWGD